MSHLQSPFLSFLFGNVEMNDFDVSPAVDLVRPSDQPKPTGPSLGSEGIGQFEPLALAREQRPDAVADTFGTTVGVPIERPEIILARGNSRNSRSVALHERLPLPVRRDDDPRIVQDRQTDRKSERVEDVLVDGSRTFIR